MNILIFDENSSFVQAFVQCFLEKKSDWKQPVLWYKCENGDKRLTSKCEHMNKNENHEKTSHPYPYKGREAKNYSKLMVFILGGGANYVQII